MATEIVNVNVDGGGDGNFKTQTATEERAEYNFRIVADSVNQTGSWVGKDTLTQVTGGVWEGTVSDAGGSVGLRFSGLKSVTFTTTDRSQADIAYVVNGEDKGVREQITVRPPFFKGLTKSQIAAVGALGLGALAAWKSDNPF